MSCSHWLKFSLLGIMTLFVSSVGAQPSDMITNQMLSHAQQVRSPMLTQAQYNQSLRFVTSSEVRFSMNSNLNAFERNLEALKNSKNPGSPAEKAMREAVRRAGTRVAAYQGLVDALNQQSKFSASAPNSLKVPSIKLSPLANATLKVLKTGNVDAVRTFLRHLPKAATQLRNSKPLGRGTGAPREVPDTMGGESPSNR